MLELRTLGEADLRIAGGAELRAVVQQPKRFALLAYLAIAAPGRYVRRDTLLGLFWPELDAEHARGALRRSLHFLRRAIGEAALIGRGEEEVGVAEQELWCDAVAFRKDLERGARADALQHYRGDLLEGFYVAGAPDVEDWLDRERRRLHEAALDAARTLARSESDPAKVRTWALRALEFNEDDAGMRGLLTHSSPLDSPRSPSLPPSPSFPRSPLLAVCPFTVHGAPGLGFLGEGMVDLLSTRLDGAGELRVVEPGLVLSMSEPDRGTPWGVERGIRLAARAGAGSFVMGSVLETAGQIEVTAALHQADGALVVRVQERADGESALFDLVDRLAVGLLSGWRGAKTEIGRAHV